MIHGGAAAVAGLLLMIAGLLLERALQVPGDDDEGKGGKKPSPTAPRPDADRRRQPSRVWRSVPSPMLPTASARRWNSLRSGPLAAT